MIYLALLFFLLALMAGFLGYSSAAELYATIGKVFFVLFLVVSVTLFVWRRIRKSSE